MCSSTTTRQIRCSSRYGPTIAFASHGRDCSSGPLNISNSRKVSAPKSAMNSSGVTTFFRLLADLAELLRDRDAVVEEPAVVLDDLGRGTVEAVGVACTRAAATCPG